MTGSKTGRGAMLAVVLAAGLAACTPQRHAGPAPTAGRTTAPQGMQGHTMAGMTMEQQMAHCAQMRRQVQQGVSQRSDMQQMIAHCDEMDRSMTPQPPR